MASNPILARINKAGSHFEISVDPDKALEFKENKASLRDALLADHIFTDAKKGQIASEEELQKAFNTTSLEEVASIILKQGEIQLSAEHRAKEREQKFRYLVNKIHKLAVDPKTKLPHPPARIEAALEQAKAQIDYNRSIDEQLDKIISKLRPIIPISIEQAKFTLTIPAEHAAKAYGNVTKLAKVSSEQWNNDGSWSATVEMPAGMKVDFLEKVQKLTHGETTIEEK